MGPKDYTRAIIMRAEHGRGDRRAGAIAKRAGKESAAGYVRIIGGRWRSRRIAVPEASAIRPTPDRVRETLFNWLGPSLDGARCLDLFAGTGVLAFEALSRGAAHAVLVERDRRAADALGLARDTLSADAEILCTDALVWLERAALAEFDVVFVDPPYRDPVDSVLEAICAALPPDARIYLERDRNDEWPVSAACEWVRRATAGGVAFGLGRTLPPADSPSEKAHE